LGHSEEYVRSFKHLDEQYLIKGGFVPYIILKIQEIFKIKLKDENIIFEKVVKRINKNVMKICIKDNFKYLGFWIIDMEINGFNVDYFSLKKVQCIFI
jgi:hypothetical protein